MKCTIKTAGPGKLVLCILFFRISFPSEAQKVFSVTYPSQADVKVFEVKYASQADLCVYRVKYPSQAKGNEGNWFFTRFASQAEKKIYFVPYEGQADLRIYFVSYPSQVGWKRKEKRYLMD